MKNEIQEHFDEFKKAFEILPVNNQANRQKKKDYLLEEIKENESYIKMVTDEIKLRLSAFYGLTTSDKIKKLSDKIESCNISHEWNEYNTSYEKMHLDFYLFQLEKYSQEDLTSVNECIKKMLESFKKVEINLTKDDFIFSTYVTEYMDLIISNAPEDKLKAKFEEIYWKFPEIIKTIGISFKSIYLKYEKKIDKYFITRSEEFSKKYNKEDIYKMKIKLTEQLRIETNRDGFLIFNKFKNNEYSMGTYGEANIEKIKSTYFTESSYTYDNLLKLKLNLFEYNLIVKYNYALNDMKERLEKKEEFKSSKATALKQIGQVENQLIKLNKQSNSKIPFLKKNDEKWLFKYNEALKDLTSKYDSFDNERFNDLIYSKLSQDSTILEVLKLVSSNYIYFVTEAQKSDESKSISDITKEFNQLKEDISDKEYCILDSIALLDRKEMKQIIVDRFKLDGINLTIEALTNDNIDKTISEIDTLINYEDICKSEIDLDDIELYQEYNKIVGEN